jgi:hypothetical protein
MWTVISEWDLGLGDVVFASKDEARAEAKTALESCGIEESLEECEGDGLVSYKQLKAR